DAMRRVWNGMIDRRPAAIARCTGAADVMAVVKYAQDHGIPVTVRGGGHHVAGKAVRDGAIVIDLAPMQGIRVDRDKKRARAEGGLRWGAFDHETLAHGLYTTGGTVSITGIGGLTLGGGLGWLMRKHGLSCDNLVGADVVTADGRLVSANASENNDLFWALRGGGGNFGVVTAFEYRLHDVEPIVGGLAVYSGDQLKDMLHFYRDFTASAPDHLETQAGAMIGPPGTPVEGQVAGWMAVCHSGPQAEGERIVAPIKAFGPPVLDFIGPTSYAAIQTMFDAGMAVTTRNYWRSSFMKTLDDDVLDSLVEHAGDMPRPGTLLLIEHMGGAISRIGEHETAFANRGARYNVSVLSSWLDPDADEKNIAWTRQFGDELNASSTGGGYVNYMANSDNPAAVRAAYEANFERLVEVKRKYDPGNFFNSSEIIKP
ncbi:MAG TPA: FAD-binding oxidoreductase, partial [Woeseiaceae bacterium]|nr:FAD-binding oxidoreductase [Woeseiaceae bacterium]